MEQITYLDFDLLIEGAQGGYSVRVLSSPAGEASANFVLPFSDLELDNIALQLGRTRRGVRRLESPEMEVARTFGRRLFEAVFTQGIRDRLRGSLGSVNRQGQGLRIRLRMSGAPELSNLPWEYLYDPSLDRFLVLSVQTPLVRYLEIPEPARPLSVKPPLNVVLMISNPEDYSLLDVEREWQKLKEALGSLERKGLVSLHRLEGASLDSLLRKIRGGEYHIFHFIGHGGFDRQAEDGVLVLEDEYRRSRLVSGRYLGTILHDHRSMRLAILNACEGARTSRTDPFAGVAQSLVQQGIPAVIAMQFEITDDAAITFSHELYGAMADGYPVDAALAEARKAIFAQDNDVEWGTPVLYLCSPNGLIFDVAPVEKTLARVEVGESVPNREIDLRIEKLYTEGLSAFWLEEWGEARRLFQSILDLRSDHEEASIRLSEAERQLNLQTLYERAQSAEREADWQGELRALEELAVLAPNYRDLPTRIETVRRQSQLAELYGEASQLHQAGKWQAVINVFAKIDAIDPQFPDPENLRTTAESEVVKLRRQEELDTLYARAVREMDAQDWDSARQTLNQVLKIQQGFRQAERLLQRAETELSHQATDRQRQEQLATLQAEAVSLAKTNLWRQVQATMEKIYELDPLFADPEGLAAKAKSEIEGEDRKVEKSKKLASLYSEAVQLLKAGEYQGALAKWGEVRSLEANYPDSQKVYSTATRRLKDVAKPPKIAVPRDISPAYGTEVAIVTIAYSWLFASLILGLIAQAIDPDLLNLNNPRVFIFLIILGLLLGAGLFAGLRVGQLPLHGSHFVVLILVWSLPFSFLLGNLGDVFGTTLYGALGGLITGLVIYRANPDLPKGRLWIITAGWVGSLLIGMVIVEALLNLDDSIEGVLQNPAVAIAVGYGFAGLVGSWVTFEAIQKSSIQRPNWRLVLGSVLGFMIGMVGANAIFIALSDVELSLSDVEWSLFIMLPVLALWGFLGGAALGIPSRSSRRIALLGGLGAAGMLIGILIWSLVVFNTQLNYHLDDFSTHQDINLCLGLGLGLALGLSTRRFTAALILPMLGAAGFLLSAWLIYLSDDNLLGVIVAIVLPGAILGLAWGYLDQFNRDQSNRS